MFPGKFGDRPHIEIYSHLVAFHGLTDEKFRLLRCELKISQYASIMQRGEPFKFFGYVATGSAGYQYPPTGTFREQ